MTRFPWVAVFLLTSATPLGAQQVRSIPRPQPSILRQGAAAPSDTAIRKYPKTYWKLGAIITGVPGFLLGAGLANWQVDEPQHHALGNVPQTIGLGLLMGAVTAIPGAMIGNLIHRHPKPDTAPAR